MAFAIRVLQVAEEQASASTLLETLGAAAEIPLRGHFDHQVVTTVAMTSRPEGDLCPMRAVLCLSQEQA